MPLELGILDLENDVLSKANLSKGCPKTFKVETSWMATIEPFLKKHFDEALPVIETSQINVIELTEFNKSFNFQQVLVNQLYENAQGLDSRE